MKPLLSKLKFKSFGVAICKSTKVLFVLFMLLVSFPKTSFAIDLEGLKDFAEMAAWEVASQVAEDMKNNRNPNPKDAAENVYNRHKANFDNYDKVAGFKDLLKDVAVTAIDKEGKISVEDAVNFVEKAADRYQQSYASSPTSSSPSSSESSSPSGSPSSSTSGSPSSSTSGSPSSSTSGSASSLAEDNALTRVLCNVFKLVTGKAGKTFAAFAIISAGVGFFTGKLQWGLLIALTLGIAAIFGAPTIVSAITGDNSTAAGACVTEKLQ